MGTVINDRNGIRFTSPAGPQNYRTSLPRVVKPMHESPTLCHEGQKF